MNDQALRLFDLKWYTRQLPERKELSLDSAIRDYRSSGEVSGLSPHPLFCPAWYRLQLEEGEAQMAKESPSLLDHYLAGGAKALDPNPFFDTRWYCQQYLSEAAKENALVHYAKEGAFAGNLPSAEFVDEVVYAHLSKRSDTSQSNLERWMKKFYWISEARKEAGGKPGKIGLVERFLQRLQRPSPKDVRRDLLRVLFVSGEPASASHVYRVDNMISALRSAGHVADWLSREDMAEAYRKFSAHEVLVVFRCEMDVHLKLLIATARRAKIPVIFDIDDLNFLPELAKVECMDVLRFFQNGEAVFRKRFANMAEVLRAADFSCSPTAFLCREQEAVSGRKSFHIPNGYPAEVLAGSEKILARRREEKGDHTIRLGYAAGTKTHQRDFKVIASVLSRVMRKRSSVRLVLFLDRQGEPLVDLDELDAGWSQLRDSIEWRPFSPIHEVVTEMARFDINLAPLELDQPRCQAKSELKFFEAALVEVATIASPTAPFRQAMEDGVTGFLAVDEVEWEAKLVRLIDDESLRRKMGQRARQQVLWEYGPQRRCELLEAAYREALSFVRQSRLLAGELE